MSHARHNLVELAKKGGDIETPITGILFIAELSTLDEQGKKVLLTILKEYVKNLEFETGFNIFKESSMKKWLEKNDAFFRQIVAALFSSKSLTSLKTDIPTCLPINYLSVFASSFMQNESLTTLCLSAYDVLSNEAETTLLSALSFHPRLTVLTLRGINFSKSNRIDFLDFDKAFPALQSLGIFSDESKPSAALCHIIAKSKIAFLAVNGLNEYLFTALTSASANKNIRNLTLLTPFGVSLSFFVFQKLMTILNQIPIERVDLEATHVKPAQIDQLADYLNSTSCTLVSLLVPTLTVKLLMALAKNKTLKCFSYRGDDYSKNITTAICKMIVTNTMLQELWIDHFYIEDKVLLTLFHDSLQKNFTLLELRLQVEMDLNHIAADIIARNQSQPQKTSHAFQEVAQQSKNEEVKIADTYQTETKKTHSEKKKSRWATLFDQAGTRQESIPLLSNENRTSVDEFKPTYS